MINKLDELEKEILDTEAKLGMEMQDRDRLIKENEQLHKQIDELADYLTKNDLILGSDKEYPAGSGACEMAIRIIKQLKEQK